MKHRIGINRLNRKASHRKSLLRNMITSLFKHERIKTTKTKAKEVRRFAEKMITRAKVDSVHNRRVIAKRLWDKSVLAKLFTDIGPRFSDRPGGYTRIIKLGQRFGDSAETVFLELADKKAPKAKKKRAKKEKVEKAAADAGGRPSPAADAAEQPEAAETAAAEADTAEAEDEKQTT